MQTYSKLTIYFLLLVTTMYAQKVRVIDNKGTIATVRNNQVTRSTASPSSKVIGDIWYNTNLTPNTLNVWDDNIWISFGEQFWSLKGNAATNSNSDFVGTSDLQDLVLKTNNIEKLRIFGTKRQVSINQAEIFNNHPLVIRANGNDVLAFQNSAGDPKWHWNLIDSGLNFVESNVIDFVLFLATGGNVGINTNNPSAKLHINGGMRLEGTFKDQNNETGTNGQILTSSGSGTDWIDATAETNTSISNIVTNGNKIADYTNEAGNSADIDETVTTFIQNNTPSTSNSSATGEITYKAENGTDYKAQIVSANANNQLKVGTDGGAFLTGPTIKSAGKIAANGDNLKIFNATVENSERGVYDVTFVNSLGSANYIIQLTIIDSFGVGNDDYDISYSEQTADGFVVQIGDNDNGNSDRDNKNSEFMFTVIDF